MNAVYLGDKPTKTGAVVNADEIPLLDSQDLSSGRKKVKKVTAANLKSSIGGVQSVVAGTNVTVDNTDPANPVVSSSGGGSGGGVKYKDVTLSAAQILATPFPAGHILIDAPGANKSLIIHRINVSVSNGGTAFNASGNGKIMIGSTLTTGLGFIEVFQDQINTTGHAPSIDYVVTYYPVTSPNAVTRTFPNQEVNNALRFGFLGTAPTEGTKSITFRIYYSIADLEV